MLKAGTAARRRTLGWPDPQSPDAVHATIAALLRAIDQRLQPHEWVGHVKIMLIDGDITIYGSITAAADEPRWSGRLDRSVTHGELTVYAAIYNLSDGEVAQAVDGALAALPADQTPQREPDPSTPQP